MAKLVLKSKYCRKVARAFHYDIIHWEEEIEFLKDEALKLITFDYECNSDDFDEQIDAALELLRVDRKYKALHPDAEVTGGMTVEEIEKLERKIQAKLREIAHAEEEIRIDQALQEEFREASKTPDKMRDEILGEVDPMAQ
jgi:hypothetical protein